MTKSSFSKYWDLRQANPIGSIALPDRVHAMDVAHPLMVVGLANQALVFVNLDNPFAIAKVRLLKYRANVRPLNHPSNSLSGMSQPFTNHQWVR